MAQYIQSRHIQRQGVNTFSQFHNGTACNAIPFYVCIRLTNKDTHTLSSKLSWGRGTFCDLWWISTTCIRFITYMYEHYKLVRTHHALRLWGCAWELPRMFVKNMTICSGLWIRSFWMLPSSIRPFQQLCTLLELRTENEVLVGGANYTDATHHTHDEYMC